MRVIRSTYWAFKEGLWRESKRWTPQKAQRVEVLVFASGTGVSKLFLKGTDSKHFKFVDYVVSERTIQLYSYRTTAAIDNMQTNGHGYVLLKLFMKTHGHSMNYCFPTSATTIGSIIFLMPYKGCLSKR